MEIVAPLKDNPLLSSVTRYFEDECTCFIKMLEYKKVLLFVPYQHGNPNGLRMLLIIIIQSTLVISNSKGLYETLRDIRTSTYQICGTEEND